MKKCLVVLFVALMAIGCVFAATDGDAIIKVQALISPVNPTFQLVASGTTLKEGKTAAVNGSEIVAELTSTTADGLAGSTAATVDFTIQQKSDAKMFGSYSFSVEVTDLVAVQPADVTESDWKAIDAANKKFSVANGTPNIKAHAAYSSNSVGFAKFTGDGTTTLTVTYLGVLKATEASPVEMGTFSCTWNANDKAIPVTYEATVTLTVSAS